VLGQLEHDPLGLETGGLHGSHEAVAGEHVVLERLRRHVEEQQRPRRQPVGLRERAAACQVAQEMRVARLLGQRERLPRAAEPVVLGRT